MVLIEEVSIKVSLVQTGTIRIQDTVLIMAWVDTVVVDTKAPVSIKDQDTVPQIRALHIARIKTLAKIKNKHAKLSIKRNVAMSRNKNVNKYTKPRPLMRIRKNVKLFTKLFTKRNKNVTQHILKNAIMMIMVQAMVTQTMTVPSMVILTMVILTMEVQIQLESIQDKTDNTTSISKSIVKESLTKIANMLMFLNKYLTENVVMSKFPKYLMCLRKNAIMLRYQNARKFRRKSVNQMNTSLGEDTAAVIKVAMDIFIEEDRFQCNILIL